MTSVKKFKMPMIIGFVFLFLLFYDPSTAIKSSGVMWDYFKEMAIIMPAVFLMMGLMEVWVSKDKIQMWLGSGSGIRGIAISLFLGTLPTGPLYVAFPMTASLLKKGASITNMVVFLGSWAALKIPQLMVEIKFLGLPFAALRFILTFFFLIIIGLLMDFLLEENYIKEKINE